MKVYQVLYKKDNEIKVRYQKNGAMFTEEVYFGKMEGEIEDTIVWENVAEEAIEEIEKIKGVVE